MEYYLSLSPIPGMLLWILLYISDYNLTLSTAKGYSELGIFRFEGSFELTPQFQKDVNQQARISKRHITYLIIYTLLILGLWFLSVRMLAAGWLYSFYLGAFLLLEVAVHVRHFRNWRQITILKREGGVEGTVTFRKRFSYQLSAFDLYSFAVLYLLVFVITFSPFFLGGALTSLATGYRHSRYAAREMKQPVSVDQNADSSSG